MAVRTATAELTARERSEPRWSVRRVIPAFVWLWVVTRLLLLVISLNPRLYSSGVYGDVRAYGAKVERMFQGELPYRDVAIEYPPGSVPFTLMPALVVGTGAGYRMAFALEMILVDALGLYAAWRLARAADRGRRRIPVAYTLGMVVIGPLLVLRFHIRRGVQIESLPANLIDLAHLAFGVTARSAYGFGAYDLRSDISGAMKLASTVATAAALVGAAWLVWRRSAASGGRGLGPADWAGAFAIGVFAFVLPTRVLSPQYLVWLAAPVAGLADRRLGRRAMWTLAAAAVLSQLEFPFRYSQLRHLDWVAASVLTVRAFGAGAPKVEQTVPEEGPEVVPATPG